jgi:cytochrome c oxidase subunit 4
MSTHQHSHHIVPLKVYLGIGTALLILTAVTVWVSTIDLGGWNVVVAIAIAAFKATLVALFFMHLKYDNKLFLYIFLIAIIFLAIFIGFTMFDTMRRGDFYIETDKPINNQAINYEEKADTTQTEKSDTSALPADSHD